MKRVRWFIPFLQCFVFLNPVFSQEDFKQFPARYELHLDANGNVPEDFWSYEIPIDATENSIEPIETKVNLLTIQDNEADEDKKTKSLINLFKTIGLGHDYPGQETIEDSVGQLKIKKIKNSLLYSWCISGNVFVINPDFPTRVISLDEPGGCGEIYAQTLGTENIRIVIEGSENRRDPETFIFDLDFKKNIITQYELPGWSIPKDLDGNGNYSVIFLKDVYREDVYWSKVYSWDGKKWFNSQMKYWKLYKTTLAPDSFLAGTYKEKKILLSALKRAIDNDEPLKYWSKNKK